MQDSPAPGTVIIKDDGPSLVWRILWFVVIGWWLSFFVVTSAVLASWTIIGIPFGIWLINRIPQAATLKFDRRHVVATTVGDVTTISVWKAEQRPFWQRALWYLLVGWWLTAIALYVAWLLCLSVIGIPLAFPIFGAAGKILTLKRG